MRHRHLAEAASGREGYLSLAAFLFAPAEEALFCYPSRAARQRLSEDFVMSHCRHRVQLLAGHSGAPDSHPCTLRVWKAT
jgi:hypothetical protein